MTKIAVIAGMAFAILAETPSVSAANGPRFDPKGNDLDAMAYEDSLNRVRVAKRERARIERRRAFIEALRLDAADAECIAEHLPSGNCLLDVRAFNRYADAAELPRDTASQVPASGTGFRLDVDSARSRLAADILRDAYVEYRFEAEPRRDSLKAEVEKAQARRTESARKSLGDAALRRLYGQYQSERFDAREVRVYRVIGSSDSAYADSLGQVCPASDQAFASPACNTLPWSRIREEEIPLTAAKALKTLRAGGTSRPIRTRFGFFLFHLESIRRVPGVPYEQAVPVLGALVTLPRGTDARNEAAMAAYYQQNRESFLAPDTVTLQAWLRPSFKRKEGEFASDIARRIRLGEPVPDTLHSSSLRIPLDSLPEEIGKRVAGMPHLEPRRFFGPINSSWGRWYFRVAENRPGTRPLSFDDARDKLMAILFPGLGTDRFESARTLATAKLNDIRGSLLSEYHSRAGNPERAGEDFPDWLRREVAMRSGLFRFREQTLSR
jgi:hypothetical protein